MKHPPVINYSAPGSLMLMGEHAVLRGKHAIVCAINQRVHVTLQPRQDQMVHIDTALGSLQSQLGTPLPTDPQLTYLICILNHYWKRLNTGFDLSIQSEISHHHGLGSSAALTAACHACFLHWVNGNAALPSDVFNASMHTVQTLKKVGSGADLAASVYGGSLLYRQSPLLIQPLNASPCMAVVYSGKKTPTDQVIHYVQKKWSECLDDLSDIDVAMDKLTLQAAQHINHQAWPALGKCYQQQQTLLDTLGVNTPELQSAIDILKQHPMVLGAKISGSGLGDCIIGVLQHQTHHDHKALKSAYQDPLSLLDIAPEKRGVCHG
jgi:mevalonate kinase